MKPSPSNWIYSTCFDCGFILAPAILTSLLVVLFSDDIQNLADMPPWLWLLLIVCVDAGHVYCSLFRTYLDKRMLTQQRALLTLTPILVWLSGVLLYSADSFWFWRVLAYVAAFHFIRQQYGFMMIYSRHERHLPRTFLNINKLMLYAAMVHPLIYWHTTQRTFNWFMAGDFITINNLLIRTISDWLYLAIIIFYTVKEVLLWRRYREFNTARNLLICGTALSWHVGIIAFDNDIIFTATNVIAHGIPYYALIWIYGYKRKFIQPNPYIVPWLQLLFSRQAIVLYIVLIGILAYLEEGMWDGFIWREHAGLFTLFNHLPEISAPATLNWLVPLLTLPQATHYVLDAFIWRLNAENNNWRQILFHDPSQQQA